MNLSKPIRASWPVLPRALSACAAPLLPSFLLSGLLGGLLSGCGPQNPDAFAPACASVGLLAEAADYTDYGADGFARPDLSRLVSHGSIVGVSGHCSNAAGGTALHTVVQVQMAIDRGPAAAGSSLDIPYFIAVTLDGAVVSKLPLAARAQFPDNGDKVLVKTDPVALDLPVTRRRPGSAYRIEVGFQLSEQQLDYNRAHPGR